MDAAEAHWGPVVTDARELGPDPDLVDLTDDDVSREVLQGASQIAALTCRWLMHVAELVVRDVWVESGPDTRGVVVVAVWGRGADRA